VPIIRWGQSRDPSPLFQGPGESPTPCRDLHLNRKALDAIWETADQGQTRIAPRFRPLGTPRLLPEPGALTFGAAHLCSEAGVSVETVPAMALKGLRSERAPAVRADPPLLPTAAFRPPAGGFPWKGRPQPKVGENLLEDLGLINEADTECDNPGEMKYRSPLGISSWKGGSLHLSAGAADRQLSKTHFQTRVRFPGGIRWSLEGGNSWDYSSGLEWIIGVRNRQLTPAL
jgi:hypothetical protein